MKSNFFIPLFFAIIIIASCRKIDADSNKANTTLNTKINSWLENKKVDDMPVKNNNISKLQASILSNSITVEELDASEKLIIAPLKSNVSFAYHKDENPANCLLFIVDKNGDIRKGNVVQYTPKDKSEKTIPKNTFHNFYNSKRPDLDGTLTFLTIGGNFLEEYEYEKGNVGKYKFFKKKKEDAPSSRTICTEWWLITTTYYSNGTIDVKEEYIGSTCYEDGDCVPGEQCDFIGDEGGGGGPPPLEMPQGWVEKSWSIVGTYWAVNSKEKMKGIKSTSYTNGGYFTDAAHVSDNFMHSPGSFTLTNKSVEVSHTYLRVKSQIHGIVTWFDPTPDLVAYLQDPNNSSSWTFNQVYP